jgi:undecaprenyl-diphosphatase
MDNTHLFELLNAGPSLAPVKLTLMLFLAKWLMVGVAVGLSWAWARCPAAQRPDLLEMLLAALLALALAQLVSWLWPQPRPFATHLGTQYLVHGDDPGLPSGHVTALWSLAASALLTRRLAPWGFPLLAVGLAVGWSRVYLGAHFPFDVLAALPVACAGALAAHTLRGMQARPFERLLDYDARLRSAAAHWRRRRHR